MHEYESLKIQNIYNFTDGSKKINEFELVKEVAQLCFRVRVLGTKATKIMYCEEKGKKPTYVTVEDLSGQHKAIIVLVMVIMGKDMEDVSKLFFDKVEKVEMNLKKKLYIRLEIPRSIREFREKFIKEYPD